MSDGQPADPSLDWPSRFRAGDVVRLRDGRVGVVVMVMDYSPNSSPPRYELHVSHVGAGDVADVDIFEPWDCTPAPDAASQEEARALRLFE